MDNVRLILFMALAFLGMLLYQSWQEDYGRPADPQVASENGAQADAVAVGDTPDAPPRRISTMRRRVFQD